MSISERCSQNYFNEKNEQIFNSKPYMMILKNITNPNICRSVEGHVDSCWLNGIWGLTIIIPIGYLLIKVF